ncbi:MAG: coenzyme F420-0:L-glutamate ligase, partial [Acidimicrobiia bacterium]
MTELRVFGVRGLAEVEAGDDLSSMIIAAVDEMGETLVDDDIVVVTHKVVSKQEGRVSEVIDDAAYRRLVEQEAASIVRRRGDLVITQTRHG